MNDSENAETMEETLLEVAQSERYLRALYDNKMNGIIPEELDFECFRELSSPIIELFGNMLGQQQKLSDEYETYAYRESICTPLNECIVVAKHGDVTHYITEKQWHDVVKPYCKSYG